MNNLKLRIKKQWIIPFLIILLALGLRIWGINGNGLPYIYFTDESTNVSIVLRMLKSKDLNPGFFNYGSLFFYINLLAYVPYILIQKGLGFHSVILNLEYPNVVNNGMGITASPITFILGRAISAILGTGSVGLVMVIAKRLGGNWVGIISGLGAAVAGINVINSHYFAPDIYICFFSLTTVYFSLNILEKGRNRDYILAGIFAGLTVSIKLNGGIIILCPLIAHFIKFKFGFAIKQFKWIVIPLLTLFVFIITNPYFLLDFQAYWRDSSQILSHYAAGSLGSELGGMGNNFPWYFGRLILYETPYTILGFIGIILGIIRKSKAAFIATIFPVVYFVVIGLMAVHNDRTLLPVTPHIILFSGFTVVNLYNYFVEKFTIYRRLISAAWVIFCLVLLFFSFYITIPRDLAFSVDDGREYSRQWINENIPPGSSIALESYSPFLDPQKYKITYVLRMIDHDSEWYRKNGIEYLVFSQGMYKRFFDEADLQAANVTAYNSLFQTFEMNKIFNQMNYEIRVYRVTP